MDVCERDRERERDFVCVHLYRWNDEKQQTNQQNDIDTNRRTIANRRGNRDTKTVQLKTKWQWGTERKRFLCSILNGL